MILPALAGGSQREGDFTLTLILSLQGRGILYEIMRVTINFE
jgi:hypothetical protein